MTRHVCVFGIAMHRMTVAVMVSPLPCRWAHLIPLFLIWLCKVRTAGLLGCAIRETSMQSPWYHSILSILARMSSHRCIEIDQSMKYIILISLKLARPIPLSGWCALLLSKMFLFELKGLLDIACESSWYLWLPLHLRCPWETARKSLIVQLADSIVISFSLDLLTISLLKTLLAYEAWSESVYSQYFMLFSSFTRTSSMWETSGINLYMEIEKERTL